MVPSEWRRTPDQLSIEILRDQLAKPVVYVVDDDEAVVSSFVVLLESVGHTVKGYTSPRRFLEELDLESSGCIVMDERMPEMCGHVLYDEIVRRGCKIPVIFCTAYAEVEYAVDEMRKGAFTVLQKPVNSRILIDAVAEALWKDSCGAERRFYRQAFDQRCAKLTTRQRQIMGYVVKGASSRAIADTLGVSERTVELHRARILRVMGVKSATELAYVVASHIDGPDVPP